MHRSAPNFKITNLVKLGHVCEGKNSDKQHTYTNLFDIKQTRIKKLV